MEKIDWGKWTNMILEKDTRKETTCLRDLPEMKNYGLSFVGNIKQDIAHAEASLKRLDEYVNGSSDLEEAGFGVVVLYRMCRAEMKSPPGITNAIANHAKERMKALKESFETLERAFKDADEALDMEFLVKGKNGQESWKERYCDKLLGLEEKYAANAMTDANLLFRALKGMRDDVVLRAVRQKKDYADHAKTRFEWTKHTAQRFFEEMNSMQNSMYTVRVMLGQAVLGERQHKAIINDEELVPLKRY